MRRGGSPGRAHPEPLHQPPHCEDAAGPAQTLRTRAVPGGQRCSASVSPQRRYLGAVPASHPNRFQPGNDVPSCPQTPQVPPPSSGFMAEPSESPPGPGTHPRASSFLRQTQQQQSRESRRMSSSARRAPAPITPIRWLASARQNRRAQPRLRSTARRPHPCPPALTHVAGARQRVAGAVVAAAGFGAVGSVAAGWASQVTAGGKGAG